MTFLFHCKGQGELFCLRVKKIIWFPPLPTSFWRATFLLLLAEWLVIHSYMMGHVSVDWAWQSYMCSGSPEEATIDIKDCADLDICETIKLVWLLFFQNILMICEIAKILSMVALFLINLYFNRKSPIVTPYFLQGGPESSMHCNLKGYFVVPSPPDEGR